MSNQHGYGAVLLVTDNQVPADTTTTAKDLGAEAVRLDDLATLIRDDDPNLVINVDLRQVENVRKLKVALRKRGTACRIFLVDTSNRVTSVHANVLGANRLLPKNATVADMHAALEAFFGIHPKSDKEEAILQSISAGVQALDASFQAMAQNIELDHAGVIRACEQIADAVCITGTCAWLMAVRSHHESTFQHCMLVTGVVAAFATKSGMPRDEIVRLTVAGLLHDIGKAKVPVAILDKPGSLTLREMDQVRLHPIAGYEYLIDNSNVDAEILAAVRSHHEYLNGTGYPDNLQGDGISMMTRIITVSDIYAALIERRSYKEPMSHTEAIKVLRGMVTAGKIEADLVEKLNWIMAPEAN